jgi:hypothetical protein
VQDSSENWPVIEVPKGEGDTLILAENSRIDARDLWAFIQANGQLEIGRFTLRVDYNNDEFDLVYTEN